MPSRSQAGGHYRLWFGSHELSSSIDLPALPWGQRDASPAIVVEEAASADPSLVPDWRHQWKSASGRPTLSLALQPAGWQLRAPGLADFLITDDCRLVQVRRLGPLDSATLEHLLLDQVLPRVLAQQGDLLLHCGAVEITGSVALFIGESGRGKSTWSAVLRQHGHRLLSDDCVLVRDSELPVRAIPTYPSLRLLPDTIQSLGMNDPAISRLADYTDKRRVPIASSEIPRDGLPVGAIYFLEEPEPDHASLAIDALSPSKTCLELIKNTFRLDPVDLGQTRQLLGRAASLAERVPAFRLRYPRTMAAMPGLATEVAEHFAKQPRP